MELFTFTDNVSASVYLNGTTKILCDLEPNSTDRVYLQEERPSGNYETVGDWGILRERNALFSLLGNYRVVRSNSNISVGYEN